MISTRSLILFVALASMPFASAGGTVEAEYLTADEESCSEGYRSTWSGHYDYYYDNSTDTYYRWGYIEGSHFYREGCGSSYRTLEVAASDEGGNETGRVIVGGDASSDRTYQSASETSYYSSSGPWGRYHSSHSDGAGTATSNGTWWSGARTEAAGSDVMLGSGCDRTAASQEDWNSYYSSSYDSEGNQTGYSWSSQGEHESVQSDRCYNGLESGSTFVGLEDRCDAQSSGRGWTHQSSYDNETTQYGYDSEQWDSTCRGGVAARAASEEAFVGHESHCDGRSYSSTYPVENGTSSSASESESCEHGFVTVELPEGLSLFVGQETWSSSGPCWDSEEHCYNSFSSLGVRASWTQSPLGPTEHSYFVGLP